MASADSSLSGRPSVLELESATVLMIALLPWAPMSSIVRKIGKSNLWPRGPNLSGLEVSSSIDCEGQILNGSQHTQKKRARECSISCIPPGRAAFVTPESCLIKAKHAPSKRALPVAEDSKLGLESHRQVHRRPACDVFAASPAVPACL
jgi:hypothetical protein